MNATADVSQKPYLKGALGWLLAMVAVMVSDDTLLFATAADAGAFILFRYFLYVALGLSLGLRCLFVGINVSPLIGFFVAAFWIVASKLANNDELMGFFYQIIVFLVGMLISQAVSFKEFLSYSKRLIVFLCIPSLIVFVLNFLMPSIFDGVPISLNSADVPVKNLYVAYIYADEDMIRNAGIFREPGVFAVYLLVALLVERFVEDRPSFIIQMLLLVAIGTTLSTTGLIGAFLIMGSGILNNRNKTAIFSSAIMVALIIAVVFSVPEVSAAIFRKFDSSSSESASVISRSASFWVPVIIASSNPFFGVGLGEYAKQFAEVAFSMFGVSLRSDGDSTNTFMSLMATYGIPVGIFFLYSTVCLARSVARKLLEIPLIFIVLLAAFSSQDMRYSLFVVSIMFFAISEKKFVHADVKDFS